MPRHTRSNPGPLYTADDLPKRTRAPHWQRAQGQFSSRQALTAYIRQQRLTRHHYRGLRASAAANGLALPLWNYRLGNPPHALSLFFDPNILIARCGNTKSALRVRDPAKNRYVTHAQHPRCTNDNGLPTSQNHGAFFKECEGYKIGVDVGDAVNLTHGPCFTICTDCASEEAERCDFTKWDPSSMLPYCRPCCKGQRTNYFARRNYRRNGGYGAPGVRICDCSARSHAIHLCSDCRTEWHRQVILTITAIAQRKLNNYARRTQNQGLERYIKDALDPITGNLGQGDQRRFILDRSRCPCGKSWRQVKTSWDLRSAKEKNEAMFRECLHCGGHVVAQQLPKWPEANDCSARFWDTEGVPAGRRQNNYF